MMKLRLKLYSLLMSVVMTISYSVISVAEDVKTGADIIERAELNSSGFKDMTNTVSMTLVDKEGAISEREMIVKGISLGDGQAKTLTVFTKPAREKGTALLTHTHKSGPDEQWLYLPASKRVKKVASSNVGASFRGSQFTFEDITTQRRENYRFDLVATEKCGDKLCFVVDRTPQFDGSSYSRTRLYIDTEYFLIQKSDFFDLNKQLLKTMTATNYTKHENGVWRPELLVMENRQSKEKTELRTLKLQFDVGLKEKDFSKLSLRKIR